MAHQLDFTVTVWSESSEALLRLERMLQLPGAGELWLKRGLQMMAAGAGEVQRVDLAGFDINWDDDSDEYAAVAGVQTEQGVLTKKEHLFRVAGDRCTINPIARKDGSIEYAATFKSGVFTIHATGNTPEAAQKAAMELYGRVGV